MVIPEKDLCAEAGFLGPSYDPFIAGNPNTKNFSVKDLTLPTGMNLRRSTGPEAVCSAELDARIPQREKSPLLDSMDEFYQKAYDLISSPAAQEGFRHRLRAGENA